MSVRILQGDALDELAAFPDGSFDALVTDPPAGIGFMGKEWDDYRRARNPADAGRDDPFGRTSQRGPEYGRAKAGFLASLTPIFAECRRVLKPGAHALVWAIPRTSHWTATALEDAGFEIRDVITHHFGSGFPKSLDVSKAIDKAERRNYVLAAVRLGLTIPDNSLHDWTKGEHSPSDAWWEQFKAVLSKDDWGRIEREVRAWAHRKNDRDAVSLKLGRKADDFAITAPATDAARAWSGWGTALKPASEHWILARAPLAEKNIAANVLAHGTGALNVDGCRIGTEARTWGGMSPASTDGVFRDDAWVPKEIERSAVGRFPANLVLSHGEGCNGECEPGCPVAEMDRQSGNCPAGASLSGEEPSVPGYSGGLGRHRHESYGDSGGASRFFYVAKPSGTEREIGLDCIEIVSLLMQSWEGEDHEARLRVDTAVSPPRVTVASTIPNNGDSAWSTFWFGNDAMGLFRRDTKCITVTATNSITESRTLSWLVRCFTSAGIPVASGVREPGGSRVGDVACLNRSPSITVEWTASPPAVGPVRAVRRLSISGNAGSAASHPTVKPVELMRYLCRLITPPKGTVLDPFMGSGTTGIAALREGFGFIGIEREAEYFAIAERRIVGDAPLLNRVEVSA